MTTGDGNVEMFCSSLWEDLRRQDMVLVIFIILTDSILVLKCVYVPCLQGKLLWPQLFLFATMFDSNRVRWFSCSSS